MSKQYILAIDQGTTSSRSMLFDHDGQVVGTAQREFTQIFPQPGWVEHNPREILTSVLVTLTEVINNAQVSAESIVGIGITNQRETAVVWDKATGQPIYNAIVWQSRQTREICDQLQADGYEDMVRSKTGLLIDAYFSGTKVKWILDKVEGAREKANKGELLFGTIDTWLIWNLTGGKAHVTDYTNASRTLMFNIHTKEWDDELLKMLDVPRAMLPEVRSSSEVYGTTLPQYLLGREVPIAGVAGDQQAALFGQACIDPGMVKVTYGTGSFVLANAGPDRPAAPDGLTVSVAWDLGAHAGPGAPVAYALEGSTFVSGAAIQWLRDGLGLIGDAAEIGPLAESVADSGGITFVPALTGLGSPWWDPAARGTITGITRGTGRAQLARAVVEAMAFQVRDMTDAMQTASAYPLSALRADGGAAAMDLLLRLQAEQSRMPVSRPRSTESTALGAATLAGLAEGMWGSPEELAALWGAEARFEPELPVELTDAVYAGWQRAVDRSRDWAG